MDRQARRNHLSPTLLLDQGTYLLVQNLVTAALLECCSAQEFEKLKNTDLLITVTEQAGEDLTAFARISKENAIPLLMIGGQAVKGYSDSEWSSYLDAAGYPKTSQLPSNYRRPAATPLTPPKPAPAAAAADTAPAATETVRRLARPPVAAPDPNAPNPNNPAGIKF